MCNAKMEEKSQVELTILMPCLNEERTLKICIDKAKTFLIENEINGEILIADNGSTDSSKEIARANGARVVDVVEKGYGAALIGGCYAAYGEYVIMGDADDSYDFLHLMPFVEKLREGYDLVMGNRFRGGIGKNAMPPLHRYLGNPVLSFIGRLLYPSKIKDFHCGLRGYNRESILGLNLHTPGMEYASEMVVKSTLHGLKMYEVPTTLKKDGRDRPPHLRSWSDGWRHLKFLLMHNPVALFLIPGTVLLIAGLMISLFAVLALMMNGAADSGIKLLVYAAGLVISGFSIVGLALFTVVYASITGYIPTHKWTKSIATATLEKAVAIGMFLLIVGMFLFMWGWVNETICFFSIAIPSVILIVCGLEILFGGFFLGILKMTQKK